MTVPATPGSDPNTPNTPTAPADPSTPPATTPPTNEPPAKPPAPAPEVIGDPGPNSAPEADQSGEAFTYQTTGDHALDVALEFIGKMGFGPQHPAVLDAVDGKFDKLEAHLSALGDKAAGWERMVALAKDAHSRSEAAAASNQTAITSAVHEVAGGEAEWAAIKDWAGKNADPSEKEAINAMLTAGPIQARAAALLLSSLYKGAPGTVVTPAAPTSPNASGQPTGNGALSPTEYGQAVRELRAKLGTRMDSSPEYATLIARRRAYRG